MFSHYLKIAFRNICKYKAQTVISICAMAVSLTLLDVVTSFLILIKPIPLLDMPYADRTVKLLGENYNIMVDNEIFSVLDGHQFESTEGGYFIQFNSYAVEASVSTQGGEDRSMLISSMAVSPDFMNFYGAKSTKRSGLVDDFADNEVVITKILEKELFNGEDAIGKTVNMHFYSLNGKSADFSFTIKDVIESSPNDIVISYGVDAFFNKYSLNCFEKQDVYYMFFVLREGCTPQDLNNEIQSLFPDKGLSVQLVAVQYNDDVMMIGRNCCVLTTKTTILQVYMTSLPSSMRITVP